MRNLTKCKNGTEPPESLLRREYFENNYDEKPETCKIQSSLLNKYRKQCNMKCPIECTFNYYILDLDIKDENVEIEHYTKTTIRLNHNQLPDFIIEHVPEITFMTFICNFAGIISLWLGFSIMSVAQDLVGLFTKFIMSKYFIIIQNTIVKKPTLSFNNKLRLFHIRKLSLPSYLRSNRPSHIDNIDLR